MPDFWTLVERLGVPLAFALSAVWALTTEKIVPGRRLEKQLAAMDARIQAMQADCDRRLDEIRTDRDYYRRIAFEALRHSERLAEGVERAIGAAEDRR